MITMTMTVCTVELPQIASGLCMSKIVTVGMRGRRRPGQQNRKAGKINMLKKTEFKISTGFELLRPTQRNPINNCDFLKFILSVTGVHNSSKMYFKETIYECKKHTHVACDRQVVGFCKHANETLGSI